MKFVQKLFKQDMFSRRNKQNLKALLVLKSIINKLPQEYEALKSLLQNAKFQGLSDWAEYPGFKFIMLGYEVENIDELKNPALNFKLSGISINSKSSKQTLPVELLIRNGMLAGIQIGDSPIPPKDLDETSVNTDQLVQTPFNFIESPTSVFLSKLNSELRYKLSIADIVEFEIDGKTFFSFYDLQDGNYLAFDEDLNTYSCIHDAIPAIKHMNTTLENFLELIAKEEFDADEHIDKRYNDSA